MHVAGSGLKTKYYPWFYKGIWSKAYHVANVQLEIYVVFGTVFILLLVRENASGFEQACLML